MEYLHKEEIFLIEKYLKIPFIVISGPSAGGKTTLSKEIESIFPDVYLLIKHTDREPRPLEKNNLDYFFLSSKQFEKAVTTTSTLVRTYRYEHRYALCVSEVERSLGLSKLPMFVLDPDAALKFKKVYPKSILVFVGPFSAEEVRNRIKARNELDIEKQKRLNYLNEEYQLRGLFDINDYCIDPFLFIDTLQAKIAERKREDSL